MSEYVPEPWPFILLALAAFRIWKLLADDEILDTPRDRFLRWFGPRDQRPSAAIWLFLVCPWCLGFWVSLAVWGAWLFWPHSVLVVCVPFAISAVVGLVATAWSQIAK